MTHSGGNRVLKRFVLAASVMLAGAAAAAEIPLKNADFEEPMSGTRLAGWSRTQHAGVGAYEISRDAQSFAHGKHSIRMQRTTQQAYGLIMQPVESTGLAGKSIELTAALKSEHVGRKGWLMVMTFKHHSNILEQAIAQPVTGDTQWTDVVLTRVVPQGTTTIEIGFMLKDGGTGWADHVRLRTVEDAGPDRSSGGE